MKSYKGNYYVVLRDKPKYGEFINNTKDEYYKSESGEIFRIHHYYPGTIITRVNEVPKGYSRVTQSKKFNTMESYKPLKFLHIQWYIKSIAKHILQSAKKHKTEKSFEL